LTADITAKNLTMSGALGNNKQYDGGTTATVDFSGASLVRVIGLDAVSINSSGYSASFLTKTVGTAKVVTVLGVTLSGGDAGNYTVSQPSGLTADITAASLHIYATTDSKGYDGTTGSSATPTYSPIPLYGTDTLTGLAQAFVSKNALGAGGSTLHVTAYTVNDGNSGNNYVVTLHTATGTITAAALNIYATSDSKGYDGTTSSS